MFLQCFLFHHKTNTLVFGQIPWFLDVYHSFTVFSHHNTMFLWFYSVFSSKYHVLFHNIIGLDMRHGFTVFSHHNTMFLWFLQCFLIKIPCFYYIIS